MPDERSNRCFPGFNGLNGPFTTNSGGRLAAEATLRAMMLTNLSLIGWLHAAAGLVAMIAGTLQIVVRKGTSAHAKRGDIYFYSMLVLNVSALVIFRQDVVFRGRGPEIGPMFGIFHWLSVITLVLLFAARFAAGRQHRGFFAYLHPICMIMTYWFLIGAAITQVFERVEWVREAALAMSPGAQHVGQFRLHLLTQLAWDLVIFVLLAVAIVQVRRHRRKRATGATQAAPASAT